VCEGPKSLETDLDLIEKAHLEWSAPAWFIEKQQSDMLSWEGTAHSYPVHELNRIARTLRRAFNRALEKELVRKVLKIKLVYAPRREVMVSPQDELRLLKAIEHNSDNRRYKKSEPAPLHDIFTIMLDTGMRRARSSVCGESLCTWMSFTISIQKVRPANPADGFR